MYYAVLDIKKLSESVNATFKMVWLKSKRNHEYLINICDFARLSDGFHEISLGSKGLSAIKVFTIISNYVFCVLTFLFCLPSETIEAFLAFFAGTTRECKYGSCIDESAWYGCDGNSQLELG